ncbi:NERD domain-containing protein [Candidatus Saccharibacteria bacterium]|nr:NERD domain-containing protein [Candidatus Saccharibacteria bacterium]
MGLDIYWGGEASRDYEYDFFREFASNLFEMFKEEELDGILIGHPVVPSNVYLKPDCVLITKNRLVLIDFKNHGGKLWLPTGEAFENSPWRHNGVIIGGGKSINPFEQLQKQKNWVEELIGEGTYGKYGIACVVCFQQNMSIMNQVPGKFQSWFSVTNAFQYLNRIRDIISVKSNKNVDLEQVASYFEAKPYHDYHPVDLGSVDAVSEANEKLERAEQTMEETREKERELVEKIKEAEANKKSAEKLKDDLKKEREALSVMKESVEKAKKEFDDKRYLLELETQRAIKARSEALTAKSEADKAYSEMQKEEISSKTKKIIWSVIGALVLAGIITFAIFRIVENNEIAKREAEEEAQLEEDYRNGRKCIPVEKVADYVGNSGVCVDFYAGYINESPYYVFVDNKKNGIFSLMISKKLISENEAKSNYLNKHLNARGTITKYEDTFEIKISDLTQITILK